MNASYMYSLMFILCMHIDAGCAVAGLAHLEEALVHDADVRKHGAPASLAHGGDRCAVVHQHRHLLQRYEHGNDVTDIQPAAARMVGSTKVRPAASPSSFPP